MKYLLLTPAIIAMILGFAVELQAIAEDASSQTIEFSNNAADALECAYTARPLNECSKDIFSDKTTKEIAETRRILDEMTKESHHN